MFGLGKKAFDVLTTGEKTGRQQLNPKPTKETKGALRYTR